MASRKKKVSDSRATSSSGGDGALMTVSKKFKADMHSQDGYLADDGFCDGSIVRIKLKNFL